MEKLLAKVRGLNDTLQQVIVFGVLVSAVAAIVVIFQIFG